MNLRQVGGLFFGFLSIFVLIGILMLAPADVRAAEEDPCAQTLQNKCIGCHTLTRICQKLGKKNKRSWKRTLKRMAKKKGTEISKKERKLLLTCLSKEQAGAKEACE